MMPSIFHKWYPRFGLFCVTIVFCIIFHCRSIVSVVLFQKLIKILVYFKTLNVSVWFYAIQHISRNCVDLMHQLDTLKKTYSSIVLTMIYDQTPVPVRLFSDRKVKCVRLRTIGGFKSDTKCVRLVLCRTMHK